ncbi:YoaK family protein [Rhizobium sp. NPDC090279]|uniref:YoaK family protein n=1 Tax=Rhizobium sp. NPDC090279 TaxID=3364499 RepID=UPI003839DCEA
MTRQRRRRLIRTRRTVTGLSLVASIAFLAGMTDAVGLMLTGNFVSFMTGNTTRAAIALGTGDFGHAAVLFSAILTFIAGNALGIVVAHAASRRAFVVLACVSILLATAAGFAAPSLVLVQFYLVVLAMGMVNATVEHIEGLPIGLTYVTGALSRFGRGIGRFLLGDRDFAWRVQIVPWSGMISGAVIGALLANALGAGALWLVSLVALALALVTLLIPRPLQRRFNQRLMIAAPMAQRSK